MDGEIVEEVVLQWMGEQTTPRTADTYEVPSASLSASMGGGSDDPQNRSVCLVALTCGFARICPLPTSHRQNLSFRNLRTDPCRLGAISWEHTAL